MSSTNKTTYFELPQFVDNDIFNPLVDDNDAYSKIDTALHNIANAEADDASEIVGIKSRLDSAEGDIDALEAQNGDNVLTTTAQTLSGAVNELDADVSALDGRLDIVEDDINNASTGLKAKMSTLDTEINGTNGVIEQLNNEKSKLQTEINNRVEADNLTSNRITSEVEARTNADSNLNTAIQNEVTARTNADNAINTAVQNEVSARTSADANLQSQINEIIAPTGEAPSPAEIENARVGYDNVTYSTLGDAIRGQIDDIHDIIDDNIVYTPSYNTITGYFVNATGTYTANQFLDATSVIDCENVKTVQLKNSVYADDRKFVFYNALKAKISAYSYDTVDKEVDVPAGAKYVVFSSGFTDIKFIVDVKSLKVDTTNENVVYDILDKTWVNDEYVVSNTGATAALVGSAKHTNMIDIAGYKKLEVITRLAGNAGICFYDADESFISGIDNTGATFPLYKYEIDVPASANYVMVSYLYASSPIVYSEADVKIAGIITNENLKDALFDTSKMDILGAFTNLTCCGDSLTWGAVYTAPTEFRQARRPYPSVLASKYGITADNISAGGESAMSWYNHYYANIASKSNQLAIIFLGTNLGLTDTLAYDAPVNTDPSTWNDTSQTGCYAKIIQKFKDVGAKVILATCWASSGDLSVTNNVIKQCADRFECGLIEMEVLKDKAYHFYPNLSGSNSVHYNDLGYSAMADYIQHKIAEMDEEYMKFIIPA